jgi:lipoprotein-anchoring transpeptidase ErfK/SrfK
VATSAACSSPTPGTAAAAPVVKATSQVRPAAPTSGTAATPTPRPPAPAKQVRRAPVNHCAVNSRPRLVKVDLSVQRAWMCARSRTVRTAPITSGASALPYRATPKGWFRIEGRNRNTTLTLDTGAQYAVKYWIPFDAPLYGFHDASWQKFPLGDPRYKRQGSHGCIHLSLATLRFLYRWGKIGTAVHIYA